MNLQKEFGQIDVYLFDQLLRGNITPQMRVLDAGCGKGRNLVWLLRQGCEVFGVDADPAAIRDVRELSQSLGTGLAPEHFQAGSIERMPFPDSFADAVICSAVLHFARDARQFHAMLNELWRVLRPGGLLFCRLGSRIGLDFPQVRENIYRVGHGAEWFLVDEQMLETLTAALNAVLVDPLKTTVVGHQRCMTTWVVRKRSEPD